MHLPRRRKEGEQWGKRGNPALGEHYLMESDICMVWWWHATDGLGMTLLMDW